MALRGVIRRLLLLLPLATIAVGAHAQRASLEEIGEIKTHGGVVDVALSPDGKYLATIYFMRPNFDVWDLQTKRLVGQFERGRDGTPARSRQVTFSPDSRYLIASGFEDTRAEPHRLTGTVADTVYRDHEVDESDLDRAVVGYVWDFASGKLHTTLRTALCKQCSQLSGQVCFTSDASKLVLLRTTDLTVFEFPSGKRLYSMPTHVYRGKELRLRHGDKMACSPTKPIVALGTLYSKDAPGAAMVATPDRPHFPILVFDVDQRKRVAELLANVARVEQVLFSADGSRLLVLPRNWIYSDHEDPKTGNIVTHAPVVSRDPIFVFDSRSWTKIGAIIPKRVTAQPFAALGVYLDPKVAFPLAGERYFLTYESWRGEPDRIKVWDAISAQIVYEANYAPGVIDADAVQDGRIVAIARGDAIVKLYRFNAGR